MCHSYIIISLNLGSIMSRERINLLRNSAASHSRPISPALVYILLTGFSFLGISFCASHPFFLKYPHQRYNHHLRHVCYGLEIPCLILLFRAGFFLSLGIEIYLYTAPVVLLLLHGFFLSLLQQLYLILPVFFLRCRCQTYQPSRQRRSTFERPVLSPHLGFSAYWL